MSQFGKLIDDLLSLSKETRFSEFNKLLAYFIKDDTVREIAYLIDHYSGEELIDKIIITSRKYKNKSYESALQCCMYGMGNCLTCLSESKKKIYHDGFIRIFSESLTLIDTTPGSDDLINHCTSIINVIEEYEDKYPNEFLLKSLIMTTIDKSAEYGMAKGKFNAVVIFYEYQRAKLFDYSEILVQFDFRLASIESKMVMPYIQTGKIKLAREVGEESYGIIKDFYNEQKEKYAFDFLRICSNLGGVYLDMNKLDDAEEIFNQGLDAWNSLPSASRNSFEAVLINSTLNKNISRLENKKSKSEEP